MGASDLCPANFSMDEGEVVAQKSIDLQDLYGVLRMKYAKKVLQVHTMIPWTVVKPPHEVSRTEYLCRRTRLTWGVGMRFLKGW